MNKSKNLCFQDILQTGWVGFLMGAEKFDPNKGTTLGAYARSWCWGAIYRSILGTRALNAAKLTIGYPVESMDYIETNDFDLQDMIDTLTEPMKSIVNYSAQGYRPKEICQKLEIERKVVIEHLEQFSIRLSLI